MNAVLIGSGNVATHLGKALLACKIKITQVFSQNITNAQQLADELNAQAIDNLDEINSTAEVYIIAIKDDKIKAVLEQLPKLKGLVLHTSGATTIKACKQFENYGVLYPLQTFSKIKSIDFRKVPLCVEANNESNLKKIKKIANLLSSQVYEIDSKKRKILHLSAVFACNFTNHMYALGAQLLAQHELEFDILRTLIEETTDKIKHHLPHTVQTGPAIRGDKKTMKRHLALLKNDKMTKRLYEQMSQSIKKTNNL